MPKHGKKDGLEKPQRSASERSAIRSMLFEDRHEGTEELEGEDRDWGNEERTQPPHPRTRSAHSSD